MLAYSPVNPHMVTSGIFTNSNFAAAAASMMTGTAEDIIVPTPILCMLYFTLMLTVTLTLTDTDDTDTAEDKTMPTPG